MGNMNQASANPFKSEHKLFLATNLLIFLLFKVQLLALHAQSSRSSNNKSSAIASGLALLGTAGPALSSIKVEDGTTQLLLLSGGLIASWKF